MSLLQRLAALAFLLGAAPAMAQESPSMFTTRVSAVGDAKVCACDESFLQTSSTRQLLIVAIGRRFPMGGPRGRWDFSYVPELLPLVFSNHTADAGLEVWTCGPRRYCGRTDSDDVWNTTSFGVGVMPIGVMAGYRVSDRMHLRTRISAGAMQLSEPVPLAQGSKFNFIADGGVGLEYRASRAVAVSAGVALNHISNGGIGRVNLGMDSRLFEIGAAISR